ncbi:MAG: hypothetical protein H5U17_09170 [Defluviimonas sp.]|nr:hypothetical protein [Defluviimonas sp.]
MIVSIVVCFDGPKMRPPRNPWMTGVKSLVTFCKRGCCPLLARRGGC